MIQSLLIENYLQILLLLLDRLPYTIRPLSVRKVLDVNSYYYLATEYLECKVCRKKFASSSQHVLSQLDMGRRSYFPAILTYR
jgi:hypothetical protein